MFNELVPNVFDDEKVVIGWVSLCFALGVALAVGIASFCQKRASQQLQRPQVVIPSAR